ncbi:hypothetical protein HK102_013807, partial [Quaeritorhiza haematococci]
IIVLAQRNAGQKISAYLKKVYEASSETKIDLVLIDDYVGTADALRHIKDKIKSDFLVISCDLITNIPPHHIIDAYRVSNPTVAALYYEPFKAEGDMKPGKDGDEIEYVGLDSSNSRLLYVANQADIDEELTVRTSMAQKFPVVKLFSTLRDGHLYIFKRWVIDLIASKKQIGSIRSELIPMLVRAQYDSKYEKKEGLDKFLAANTDILQPIRTLLTTREYVEALSGSLGAREEDSESNRTATSSPQPPKSSTALSGSTASGNTPSGMVGSASKHSSKDRKDEAESKSTTSANSITSFSSPSEEPDLSIYSPNLAEEEGVVCMVVMGRTTPGDASAVASKGAGDAARSVIGGVDLKAGMFIGRANTTYMYGEINRQHLWTTLFTTYISHNNHAIGVFKMTKFSSSPRIASSAEVNAKAQVGTDSMIGAMSKVGERCSVKRSVIGAHCNIGKNVKISNAVIMDYVTVADNVKLDGCVVCNNAQILDKSQLKDCEVGANVVVEKDSK